MNALSSIFQTYVHRKMMLRLILLISLITSTVSTPERFNYSCELEQPEQGKTMILSSGVVKEMTFSNKYYSS